MFSDLHRDDDFGEKTDNKLTPMSTAALNQ